MYSSILNTQEFDIFVKYLVMNKGKGHPRTGHEGPEGE